MLVKEPQELFIIYKTSDKENKIQGKKTWHSLMEANTRLL